MNIGFKNQNLIMLWAKVFGCEYIPSVGLVYQLSVLL